MKKMLGVCVLLKMAGVPYEDNGEIIRLDDFDSANDKVCEMLEKYGIKVEVPIEKKKNR